MQPAHVSLWLRLHMPPEDEQADYSPVFTNLVEEAFSEVRVQDA
jgi:hypothetical protein